MSNIWTMTWTGIVGYFVAVFIGAALSFLITYLREKYSHNKPLSAALDYLANAIADLDNKFARPWKQQNVNENFKLKPAQVSELETLAYDEAKKEAQKRGNKKALSVLDGMTPPEVSKHIKEIKTQRLGD